MGLSTNIKLQSGDDLWIVHIDQLVFLNCKDLYSDSFQRMTPFWLDQKFPNIKIVAFPSLCNAYVHLN